MDDEIFQKSEEEQTKNEGGMSESGAKKGKKVTKILLTVLLSLVIAATAFTAGWIGRYYALGKKKRNLLWAIDTATENYYEDIEDRLYDALFSCFSLDDYSCYYPKEEYEAVVDDRNGNNLGFGFSYFADGDGVRLYRTVGNSPVEIAGMKRGMYLLAYGVSSESMTETTSMDAFGNFMEGLEGNDLVFRCGFERDGSDARDYAVTRCAYSATYAYYRDSETGFCYRGETPVLTEVADERLAGLSADTAYVCLERFTGNVVSEFKGCLAKMRERGRKNLILDLRSNGGGYMDMLVRIAACLVKDAGSGNNTIAYAEYKDGSRELFAVKGSLYSSYFSSDSKITVLADEGTASASECLIGALYSYGSISFGDIYLRKDSSTQVARTYGKGIMQTYYNDGDGNALKLTSAKIYWPNGNCIHGKGVTEADGAKAVEAVLVPYADDVLLNTAVSEIG